MPKISWHKNTSAENCYSALDVIWNQTTTLAELKGWTLRTGVTSCKNELNIDHEPDKALLLTCTLMVGRRDVEGGSLDGGGDGYDVIIVIITCCCPDPPAPGFTSWKYGRVLPEESWGKFRTAVKTKEKEKGATEMACLETIHPSLMPSF